MNEDLRCSSGFEEKLRDIRDLLYRAVQSNIGKEPDKASTATKEPYEALSTALDSLQSNLKNPGRS
jgi:hypothetical protein